MKVKNILNSELSDVRDHLISIYSSFSRDPFEVQTEITEKYLDLIGEDLIKFDEFDKLPQYPKKNNKTIGNKIVSSHINTKSRYDINKEETYSCILKTIQSIAEKHGIIYVENYIPDIKKTNISEYVQLCCFRNNNRSDLEFNLLDPRKNSEKLVRFSETSCKHSSNASNDSMDFVCADKQNPGKSYVIWGKVLQGTGMSDTILDKIPVIADKFLKCKSKHHPLFGEIERIYFAIDYQTDKLKDRTEDWLRSFNSKNKRIQTYKEKYKEYFPIIQIGRTTDLVF